MTESAEATPQPLLTIVTVMRDDLEGLTRTRTSILEQHVLDANLIEWLIVDSSSDQAMTDAVIERENLTVPTRRIWVEPAGVYPAMNFALENVCGTFVLFLNSGDCLASPTVLDLILHELNAPESSSLTWWVGRVCIIDRAGKASISAAWDFAAEKRHMFARGMFPPHQATIVRAQALRDLGGFDTSYRIAADYRAALQLSVLADPVVCRAVIAKFYEGGISTTQWKRAAAEFHRARLEVFEPSPISRVVEGWHTLVNSAAMLVYRDILRRDR